MPTKSIVITENPITNWEMYEETLDETRFAGARTTHRDQGGFYQAFFEYIPRSREDAIAFLNNGLGRNVVFSNERGQINFEGFINTIKMDTGTAQIKNSLNDMTNKVWTRYTPVGGGAVTRGTVMESAISQARYGIKEVPLSGGEISNTLADQLAQAYLNLHYWPIPQLDQISLGGKLLDKPRISVDVYGYFRTLEWRVYNQTAAAGTQNATAQVGDIITAVGDFIEDTYIEANASVVTKEYDADRKAADILQSIADLGNDQYRIFIVGVEEGRKFYYKESAPPVRIEL